MPRLSLKSWIYPLILIAICLCLAFVNYTPGTFLTGWDTLHPELNFPLSFSRLINGVWRSEQGLGAIAGHSHMADLPRVAILWLCHFALPLNFLRYSYIFLCLVLGPLGIYFLLKHLFKNRLIAFLGALFYLLNLSTVQQFYVPFEMFPTQWAFLPWIILFSLKYLQTPRFKNLIGFITFTLLATPQAYAAQLWYAFFGCYLLFLIVYSALHHHTTKLSLCLAATTLIINSFWLLPNVYYILTSSSIPKNAKVNRLYSQEYLLDNRVTGTLADIALQKGFYLNWAIYQPASANFSNLMPEWNHHFDNPFVRISTYLFFALSLVGIFLALIKKDKDLLPFFPIFLIPFSLLANRTPLFSYLFDFLLRFPLLEEALRFVFTKFSILLTFSLAIFFAYSLLYIFQRLDSYLRLFSTTIVITLLFVTTLPAFQGFLISPAMRLDIPSEYFSFWQYSSSLSPGKVLPLPLYNFTGWQYYRWGYQGAGFIWFNLPSPILDRDFDRWAPQNEEAFREFFYTLYSKDPDKFLSTLNKYQIKYLLWDQNLIYPEKKNRDQILFSSETNTLLNTLIANHQISPLFHQGNLYLYQITSDQSLIYSQNLTTLFPSFIWNYWDGNYINSGDYITTPNSQPLLNLDEQVNLTPDPSQTRYLSVTGATLELPTLSHSQAFEIGIHAQHLSGLPTRLCLKNDYTNLCTVSEKLGDSPTPTWYYYLLPPLDDFSGYTFSFDNVDIPPFKSQNIVDQISLTPLDSAFFDTKPITPDIKTPIISSGHDFFFKVKTLPTDNTLILSQSFHPGWLAFYFNGLKPVFLRHELVNNWANAWDIKNIGSKTVYILFWPQLLEFLGFILIPLWLFFSRPRQTPSPPSP